MREAFSVIDFEWAAENAYSSIVFTVDGIVIDVRFVSENALSPIWVVKGLKVIDDRFLHL